MPRPYFNADNFPEAQNEYVLWVDIMGTKNKMSTSVKTCSIFICKLHMAILDAKTTNMHVYPMMDGAYVTTKNKNNMKKFIKKLFESLTEAFVSEENQLHKFIIKGALAYGPVIHGTDIPSSCNNMIENNKEYINSILLGIPMIQACKGERNAPPFGIYCDETVRIADSMFSYIWYKWYDDECKDNILTSLDEYFDYSKNHCFELEYEENRIEDHRKRSKQYFSE